MNVQVIDVRTAGDPVLARLAQLYQHDFSEFDGADVDESGRFTWFEWETFFTYQDPHAFVIRTADATAGFACLCKGEAFRDPSQSVWWMDQFFVMRKYRRVGIGSAAAERIFERFPGMWEVAQLDTNPAATSFWRKVVDTYTHGDFAEFTLDDGRTVQYFESR